MRILPLLAAVLLTAAGCGIDHDVTYEPAPEPIFIPATGHNTYAFSPTISSDGRVVAWIERVSDPGRTTDRIIRWDRDKEASYIFADTIWRSDYYALTSIDLSDDGWRIAGCFRGWSAFSVRGCFLWDRGGDWEVVWPDGFDGAVTASWSDTSSSIFGGKITIGAEGPEGRGVYEWDLETDIIVPLVTHFPDEGDLAADAWVDGSRERACMGETDINNESLAIVYGRDGRVLFRQEGSRPRFWRLVGGEPEGLLYINAQGNLSAARLGGNDPSFLILRTVQDFDVSTDGSWLIARALMGGDQGIRMVLADTRDLR